MALVLVARMPEHKNFLQTPSVQTIVAPSPPPAVPSAQEFYGARFLPQIGANIYSSGNDASENVASVFYGDIVVYGNVYTGTLVQPSPIAVSNLSAYESWPIQHRDTHDASLQMGTCASWLLTPGGVLNTRCMHCSASQFISQREKCCVTPDKCQTSNDSSCYRMPTKEACERAGCLHSDAVVEQTINNVTFQTQCLPSGGILWQSTFERQTDPGLDKYRTRQDKIYKTLGGNYRNAMSRPSYYLPDPLVLPAIEYALFGENGQPLVAIPVLGDP